MECNQDHRQLGDEEVLRCAHYGERWAAMTGVGWYGGFIIGGPGAKPAIEGTIATGRSQRDAVWRRIEHWVLTGEDL